MFEKSWTLEQIEKSLRLLDELLAKAQGEEERLKYGVAYEPTNWALECLEDVRNALECLYRAAQWGLDAHPSHCVSDVNYALALLGIKEGDDKATEEKTKWAVVHLIHVRVPNRHIARLFVVDVPKEVSASEVKSKLVRAGYWFGDFGVMWANHYLAPQEEWCDEVVGAYNAGLAEKISWKELVKKAEIMD